MAFTFAQNPRSSVRPPARIRWRWRWFGDALLFLAIWGCGTAVLFFAGPQHYTGLIEGQRAPSTVIATVDFDCIDHNLTDMRRHQAAEMAPPVFRIRTDTLASAIRTQTKLADRAIQLHLAAEAFLDQEPPAAPKPAVAPVPAAVAADSPDDAAPETAAEAAPGAPPAGLPPPVSAAPSAPPSPPVAAPAAPTGAPAEPGTPAPDVSPDLLEKIAPVSDVIAQPGKTRLTQKEIQARIAEDLNAVSDLFEIDVSGQNLAALFPAGREKEVLAVITETLHAVWRRGIVSPEERESRFQGIVPGDNIALWDGASAFQSVSLDALPLTADAADAFAKTAKAALDDIQIKASLKTLRALVAPWIRPNLDFDSRKTAERKKAAAAEIKPVAMSVRTGTTLMQEHEIVTAQTVETVTAYNRRLAELEPRRDRLLRLGGKSFILFLVLAVCFIWEKVTRPVHHVSGVAPGLRRRFFAFLAFFALLLIGLSYILCIHSDVLSLWIVPYLLPSAIVSMFAALLAGPSAALAGALWMALAADTFYGSATTDLTLPVLASSIAAVLSLRHVRKRAQVMRAGFFSGLAAAVVAVAMAVLHRHPAPTLGIQIAAAVGAGLASSVIVLLLLPLLEALFRCPTDISLLELTDAGHPLLRRLALEAPGTYHHSLMVAILGQAAAEAIGANPLLVTVCAYFHDIGKLAKPEFFTENQRPGENPHDQLAPAMSALVIQSHVREGLTLAKRHKLPRLVRDAIGAHHGDSLTSFFYQLALRDLRAANLPEDPGLESSYRYPGPRPFTREQGILMLADTVEAASRSLDKPTPKRISDLVERLVADKMADHQLDACPLTLAECTLVRESLVAGLTNIFHGRSPYPNQTPDRKPANGPAPAPADPPPPAP